MDQSYAGIGVLIIAAVLYFIPTILATQRDHRQLLAIFALNFLLGWTIIGWAGALVWSCTVPSDHQNPPTDAPKEPVVIPTRSKYRNIPKYALGFFFVCVLVLVAMAPREAPVDPQVLAAQQRKDDGMRCWNSVAFNAQGEAYHWVANNDSVVDQIMRRKMYKDYLACMRRYGHQQD